MPGPSSMGRCGDRAGRPAIRRGRAADRCAAWRRIPAVIAHAPRQDLGLIAARFPAASEFPELVDTQLLAAFAGMGDQLGLAALVRELFGTTLDKDQQWTAWGRRPLSDAQLRYAADDVRYLPAIFDRLSQQLGKQRRSSVGVRDEDRTARTRRGARRDPARPRAGVARRRPACAAWATASSARCARSRPWPTLVSRPRSHATFRSVPCCPTRRSSSSRSCARSTQTRCARGSARASPSRSRVAAGRARRVDRRRPRRWRASHGSTPSPRAQRWTDVLLAIANRQPVRRRRRRCRATGIRDPRRCRGQAFARALRRGVASTAATRGLPAARTWRKEVLLDAWDGWLAGRVALVADSRRRCTECDCKRSADRERKHASSEAV